jgi:hypothetical protein
MWRPCWVSGQMLMRWVSVLWRRFGYPRTALLVGRRVRCWKRPLSSWWKARVNRYETRGMIKLVEMEERGKFVGRA